MSGNVLKLSWVSFLFLVLASCAHKPLEMVYPEFPDVGIKEALEEKKKVTGLEATFSVTFAKPDSEIRGDGALDIASSGDMSMRLYSLGFLALELESKDGVVTSSPHVERNKTLILTEGLRDCLFWWNMEDYTADDEDGRYVLRGPDRKVVLDKKSFLPLNQVVWLDDGRQLRIFYDLPVRENGVWYQSKIRIELNRYSVTLMVKNLAVKNGWPGCRYCSL